MFVLFKGSIIPVKLCSTGCFHLLHTPYGRVTDYLKGALKAHRHISLYESNTLQEQDAALLFLSVIPRGEIFAYCHLPDQALAATGCDHVFPVLSAITHWVAEITSCLLATSGQCA